ncbi:hypothetical protein R1T08_17210 [Streptomyces sp. SBC-4]|nr:hypothetical protein [Streptomyces sp. SBC-4]MDV5145900.1 hypothetical protein [Streptomyces sp. SBC-4]
MTGPFPTLTPVAKRGTLRCAYVPSPGAAECGGPATSHIAWHLTPGSADFSLVCTQHLTVVQQEYVYVDRHPAEAACDMPGTGWLVAGPSRCVLAPTADTATREGRVQ